MRILPAAAAALLVLSVAACGDSDDDAAPAESTQEAPQPAPEAEPTQDAPEDDAEPTDATGAEGGGTLTASVGEEGDPDAFTITLTDADGEPVTDLPAGDYTIEVDDPSTIHNFNLSGPGVEETTTVEEVTTVTWDVTFEAGEYTFVCDPHPDMRGEFTVS